MEIHSIFIDYNVKYKLEFKMFGKKSEKLYEQLKLMNNKEMGLLMDQLTYGKKMQYFNTYALQRLSIVLYLHEANPEILMAVDQHGATTVIDIRRLKLSTSRKYGIKYALEMNKYIVLEDYDDQIILYFNTENEMNSFYFVARNLMQFISKIPSEIDSSTMKIFIKADTNNNFLISANELKHVFEYLKFEDEAEINNVVKIISIQNKSQNLRFKDFQIIAKFLSCKQQLIPIFQTYTGFMLGEHLAFLEKVMDKNTFGAFLIQCQKQQKAEVKRIIKQNFKNENSKMSFADFCNYLCSAQNDITSEEYFNHECDVKLPLTSYLCYSSHNTYLTGNQITSNSSAQRYYEDVCAGVRCVEIDTHDGQSGPIVKHGYTLTSAVTFKQVLRQIVSASKNSKPTPIILSLENHCNSKNQLHMVNDLKECFDDKILLIQNHKGKQSLTLEEAMNKIIIKGSGSLQAYKSSFKSGKDIQVQEENQSDDQSMISQNMPGTAHKSIELSEMQKKNLQKNKDYLTMKKSFDSKIENWIKEKNIFVQQTKQIDNLSSKYRQQVNYKSMSRPQKKIMNTEMLRITSMLGKGSLGTPNFWESVSLSQDIIKQHYSNSRQIIERHTHSGWIRSYPKSSRFDSSNYNPFPSIEMGVQLIAINTQMADYPALLMKKFFEKGINKTPGYRMKPVMPTSETKAKQIRITPFSASKIYFNKTDLKDQTPPCQIRMRLYCYSGDLQFNQHNVQWREYTESINNNAFNPMFKRRITMNIKYTCAELSFVMIEIRDAGIGVIPLEAIRKGFRTVTLYDNDLKPKDSRILVNVQVQ